jgi:hypothetical protein
MHHYLGQHPEVFVPAHKSPSYFYCIDATTPVEIQRRLEVRNYFVPDLRDYVRLFETRGTEPAVGEVSPVYLSSTRVAGRIAEWNPEMRIIAVLRNPVDRVRARYVARRQSGLERAPDLAAAIAPELDQPLDLDDTAGTYLAAGFTSHLLRTYVERFPSENLCFRSFDDLVADPQSFMAGVFAFLGVDTNFEVDMSRVHNKSGGQISNPLMRFLWSRSALARTAVRPYIPVAVRDRALSLATWNTQPRSDWSETARFLTGYYAEEVKDLASITGLDLGKWFQADDDEDPGSAGASSGGTQ